MPPLKVRGMERIRSMLALRTFLSVSGSYLRVIPITSGGSGNWVSLYFPHPEWGNQWGDNFTQDVVLEDDEFFQSNLTVWPVEVLSNMSGQTSVTFE